MSGEGKKREGKKGREGGSSKQKEELNWKEMNNVVTSVSGELYQESYSDTLVAGISMFSRT